MTPRATGLNFRWERVPTVLDAAAADVACSTEVLAVTSLATDSCTISRCFSIALWISSSRGSWDESFGCRICHCASLTETQLKWRHSNTATGLSSSKEPTSLPLLSAKVSRPRMLFTSRLCSILPAFFTCFRQFSISGAILSVSFTLFETSSGQLVSSSANVSPANSMAWLVC